MRKIHEDVEVKTMRNKPVTTVFLIFLATGSTAIGQHTITDFKRSPSSNPSGKLSPEDYTQARLKRFIGATVPLTPAFALSILYRMGDGVAAGILEIMKGRGPLNAMEQQNVIDMVRLSFTAPGAIRNHAERQPISSLILLGQLNDTVSNADLRERLGETQRFLLDTASRAK
jgi:hypothetical protein